MRWESQKEFVVLVLMLGLWVFGSIGGAAEPWKLQLRDQVETKIDAGDWIYRQRSETWKPEETAIIVCDVWDFHHSINAVRRLDQFASRLNQLLKTAREQGAIIIHAPSDCMETYASHPARIRAQQAPRAANLPFDITSWCSVIPAEERGVYPIDQSDGGEDDDPEEHREWAAKLAAMGRKPGTPWKAQNDAITIDAERDYISDRGDEVWNVLEQRAIRNVVLTGVHLNMCVLGRPFGLRQMVRNGRHTVLVRDLTDTMYNPRRWPYVTHDRGTELMVAHVERFVCPTITSDQILGDRAGASSSEANAGSKPASAVTLADMGLQLTADDFRQRWVVQRVPGAWAERSAGVLNGYEGPGWYRCVVRIPADWLKTDRQPPLQLQLPEPDGADPSVYQAWLNGTSLVWNAAVRGYLLPREQVVADDHNLLVLRVTGPRHALAAAPRLQAGDQQLRLAGRWQFRTGDDPTWVNMPLPAKFGGAADTVFTPEDPPFVARAITRPGAFTPGIEGPATDAEGNVYAVNFAKQGTIGRITPQGATELFVELPAGSIGNGIQTTRDGFLYVADYTGHNILKIDPRTKAISVFAHNPQMNQPNDLALHPNGTLFASDPNWGQETGQLWRIERDGSTHRLAEKLGTTNGIEVSPDGKTLYVNESVQLGVWAYPIQPDMTLGPRRLVRQFPDHGFDGMRCDVDGNLYITRYGKGTVVKLSPNGEILQEISLPGSRPSNICLGGPDGRTAFVTEVEFTQIVAFRIDQPGQAWTLLNSPAPPVR